MSNGEKASAIGAAFSRAVQPGDVMQDGTVYAGLSPRTQKPLYVTPQDAPGGMDWDEAQSYAQALTAHGHNDWRIPDREDLNLIFENSAAIGGFNKAGSFPAGWYWSSSEVNIYDARNQRFSAGTQNNLSKHNGLSVRCVRG